MQPYVEATTVPVRPSDMRTVLILGAGEILEAHLAKALAAQPGYQPVVLSGAGQDARTLVDRLKPNDGSGVPNPGLLNGADCVINCMSGSPGRILAVTQALIEAARRNPPRRIIHVSSMSVYGAANGVVEEATSPTGPLNTYTRIRIDCENMMRQYAADGGDAVILRPSCILGPDSEAWSNRIARLLTAGRLGDLGAAGDGICNLIPVDDLVSVVIAMLSAQDVSGETFNVSATGPTLTWNDFLLRFARAIGATPVRRISARRLRMEQTVVAPALRVLAGVTGKARIRVPLPDALTPSFVRMLQQDITISTDKLTRQLQRPCPPLGQQIEATARTWRYARNQRAQTAFVATAGARPASGSTNDR